jgi:tagaturonate epimerase
MIPGKYSMGIGDRFGHQGANQLRAITEAGQKGITITPVWNKSNREHLTTGTKPEDVRTEADNTVAEAGFTKPYFVDADHINYDTVDRFIPSSDYFTIDVAAFIGKRAEQEYISRFLSAADRYKGKLSIGGIAHPFIITSDYLADMADRYLLAAIKAGEVFRKIGKSKGNGNFIAEISLDEVTDPQRPSDLFFILMMLGMEEIALQTIAPKFSGRFNKGVDYEGDPLQFAGEFEADLLVIDRAVKEFGLPPELKLSIHSGSDKFSIYPHIGRIIRQHDKGIHIKTAGTTWIEEIIGLSLAGGEATGFVREICLEAFNKLEELCAPYKDVINVKESLLPSRDEIKSRNNIWLAESLRHIPGNNNYNPHFRQLLHVAYKLAASRIDEYFSLLERYSGTIGECVFENLYHRHISRIFGIN